MLASTCLALLIAPLARGHEFWIEPSDFHPAPGALVSARVLVGEGFLGESLPRNEAHIVRFLLAGPGGETPMIGAQGREPAGAVRVATPGFQLIGYQSHATTVTLTPDKLGVYLANEGLEPFFDGDRNQPIDDHFSRCAKALLLAGENGDKAKGYDRQLGCPLELVPEANPFTAGRRPTFPLRLLRNGKPIAGVQVSARKQADPERRISARTDAQGRVRLALAGPGIWLVNAVYLEKVPGSSSDWQSQWASLTFEIPATAFIRKSGPGVGTK